MRRKWGASTEAAASQLIHSIDTKVGGSIPVLPLDCLCTLKPKIAPVDASVKAHECYLNVCLCECEYERVNVKDEQKSS